MKLEDGCGNADGDHLEDDRGDGCVGPQYAATISSRAKFLQVVEMVKNELSLHAISGVHIAA